MTGTIELGVNIDHVATLRQARRGREPSAVEAALVAEQSGADNITLHLREDRRHIQDADVETLRPLLKTRMNLEMAVTDEMIAIARRIRPADCCLVPERRAEITTEGGLDVVGQMGRLRESCALLAATGIRVALFIDPELLGQNGASGGKGVAFRASCSPLALFPTGEYDSLANVPGTSPLAVGPASVSFATIFFNDTRMGCSL